MTTWVHNSQCQPYEVDSLAVPMMRTCWIFALSSQCGIFTTMIVEGLQIVLEISCLSAIWISDDHNGSVSLQHKKTWKPSMAYLRVVWIAWQSRTAFTVMYACLHSLCSVHQQEWLCFAVPVMSTLLNISTDHAVRNLYHHDRWGLAS